MPQPLKSMRNLTFGRLRVLKHAGTARNGSLWECLCDCGTLTTKCGSALRRGHTRSCGCLRRATGRAAAKRLNAASELRKQPEHA
jgi:hypothetical protein